MSLSDYPAGVLIREGIARLTIPIDAAVFHAMTAMEMASQSGLPAGLSIVLDAQRRLAGVMTDGDVREALLKGQGVNTPVTTVMTSEPVVIHEATPPESVLHEIRRQVQTSGRARVIRHAILVDDTRHVLGLIDVDQLVRQQPTEWDTIGVVGLGYVGLTLAVSLAELGAKVIGWDRDERLRSKLRAGVTDVYEAGLEGLLKAQLAKDNFSIASSYEELKSCRVFIICVNTPVHGTPVLEDLRYAVEGLKSLLKPADLVVIRCTVPVGTCRGLVKPALEEHTPYRVGQDIGLVFAPERSVEGRALEELRSLPQVLGGTDHWSVEVAARLFSKLSPTIVRVDTLEEAEFIKLINNSFRDLSFAFANEVAMMCEAYNLNAAKIIKAANSGYPRNPIAMASPGVGGACLHKDPYMLAWTNRQHGQPSLSEVGRRVNEQVPLNITQRLIRALEECEKEPSRCTLFILGFAFKGEPETRDMRNSPTLDVIALLQNKIGTIWGYDPVVPREQIDALGVTWRNLEDGFAGADAVLVMTNHRCFSSMDVYALVKQMKPPAIFFDGWALFEPSELERRGVRYMGLGYLTPWVAQRAMARV